ncbi:ROK family transcriptional regulator [Paenibacillus sp. OV219]|uniref:ROK family transcriptional regulator n=1 Tax=Paenibacillus sp. OV219 TaxID=1884377 RepID=UPI001160CE66|nr:ROK family transcriptional regulator [Paenibacillus sp. OV219]
MTLNPSEREVLRLIYGSDGISRKALAEMSGLSQASLTKITKTLTEQEQIEEGERIGKGLGRKEVLLYANPRKYRYLGIDIGSFSIRLAVSDNGLNITHRKQFQTAHFSGEEPLLDHLTQEIAAFLEETGSSAIDAIGIGVSGIVDAGLRRIVNIPNVTGWDNLHIADHLSAAFQCPVYLDEGGRTMALAEKMKGKARGSKDFVVVHIGFGIVAGIMINGSLLRGYHNVGGLLGHTTVDESAGRCRCGNYGCLENVVTFPILEAAYRQGQGDKSISIVEAYALGDKVAIDICLNAGKALGIALSNLVNLFNPEAVYIGGAVAEQLPLVLEETKRTILLRANRFATVGLRPEVSSFGNNEGLMGSLTLAASSFLF